MVIETIGLLVGALLLLFGIAIIGNAAFEERSQMGFYVCISGAAVLVGAVLELIF